MGRLLCRLWMSCSDLTQQEYKRKQASKITIKRRPSWTHALSVRTLRYRKLTLQKLSSKLISLPKTRSSLPHKWSTKTITRQLPTVLATCISMLKASLEHQWQNREKISRLARPRLLSCKSTGNTN